MTLETSAVEVSQVGTVAVVRMDDGRVNALSLEMTSRLRQALDSVRDAGAIVLAGREGCFSAGLDRKSMLGTDPEVAIRNFNAVNQIYMLMLTLPAPTIVACTGHALAAGAVFLLVTDVRFGCRTSAKIGLNEVQIGLPLVPIAVATARARLASTAFVRATLGGAVYDPVGAAEVGYLDEVVEPADLLERSIEHASRLAKLNRRAYVATRELILAPILEGYR
jgi:enoyl-CoA hydratase